MEECAMLRRTGRLKRKRVAQNKRRMKSFLQPCTSVYKQIQSEDNFPGTQQATSLVYSPNPTWKFIRKWACHTVRRPVGNIFQSQSRITQQENSSHVSLSSTEQIDNPCMSVMNEDIASIISLPTSNFPTRTGIPLDQDRSARSPARYGQRQVVSTQP